MSHTSTPVTENTISGAILGNAPLVRSAVQSAQSAGSHLALSPDGRTITIPKELFVALSDFLKTRKCPGSVTIEFRCDEIVGVETFTKRRFPSKL